MGGVRRKVPLHFHKELFIILVFLHDKALKLGLENNRNLSNTCAFALNSNS